MILYTFVTLLIGLLVVNFLTDLIGNVLIAVGIDYLLETNPIGITVTADGMHISGILSGVSRVLGYLIFVAMALNILNLTIIAQLIEGI